MNFRLIVGTVVAMLAFAGNSVLCRLALEQGSIDPASFTSVRLLSGALILFILLFSIPKLMAQKTTLADNDTVNSAPNKEDNLDHRTFSLNEKHVDPDSFFAKSARLFSLKQSNWSGGLSLFLYAAGFSFAYITLPTGTGALILFATVQITMLSYALVTGSRFSFAQWVGFAMALAGLVYLFLPGISAPPIFGALLMAVAGIAWGIYSILGKRVINPTQSTAENFIRASIITSLLSLIFINSMSISAHGLAFAIASGAITSGIGYAIWYAVIPHLKAASSASLQLTVPVIATVGGVIWLGEEVSIRLALASISILGGVAMVVLLPKRE
jgi:drug/metabolite transporter (DMT)-like permease